MDENNPVVQLCVKGTQAEFAGDPDKAHALYQAAWVAASNDFEACIAAHYVACFQDDPQEKLRWNQIALEKAEAVSDGSVKDFYPSLYINIGQSYESVGNTSEAKRYYDLAAKLGLPHQLT
ncbi:hypothetical protein SDC9_68564 [bioreactor metagenome]|uniref:Tetratricopeptide repeat protein n=1 Tax=bioreactor metagenome TaxID=1076179 RepID=A0A644Y7L4_9ZZZZ